MRKTGLLLLLLTATLCHASVKAPSHQEELLETHLLKTIHSQVSETIQQAKQYSDLQEKLCTVWDTLVQDGALEVSSTDQEVRPYFVALQGIVEQVLASLLQKDIKALTGFIHTPMPATPLCTLGEISPKLVDASLAKDPARLASVKARTVIMREYLTKGGDLYIVYPKDGFAKRTQEQQKIYKQELINYPNHLFDVPLNRENIPEQLIGATYFFQDQLNNTFVFAIKMTQANDPKDIGNFGLWFGQVNHPAIEKRIQAVSIYVNTTNSKKT
ncbi:MAG: hypothetical protein K2Y01_04110 [Rhabdochlamydiaceae bacterium]|nr:hypothetical protein [Rhabdochlamydiaceae bacterium]